MLGWIRRVLTPSEPPRPRVEARLTQLENLCDDFDSRIDYLASELKKVRGRQFAMEKSKQDDVGEAIDQQADNESVHQRPGHYVPTAHLARRFKGG